MLHDQVLAISPLYEGASYFRLFDPTDSFPAISGIKLFRLDRAKMSRDYFEALKKPIEISVINLFQNYQSKVHAFKTNVSSYPQLAN